MFDAPEIGISWILFHKHFRRSMRCTRSSPPRGVPAEKVREMEVRAAAAKRGMAEASSPGRGIP